MALQEHGDADLGGSAIVRIGKGVDQTSVTGSGKQGRKGACAFLFSFLFGELALFSSHSILLSSCFVERTIQAAAFYFTSLIFLGWMDGWLDGWTDGRIMAWLHTLYTLA